MTFIQKLLANLIIATTFALISPLVFSDDITNSSNPIEDITYYKLSNIDQYLAKEASIESVARYFLGMYAGGSIWSLKTKITDTSTENQLLNKHSFGFVGGAYTGIGVNIKNFYIGTELSCNYNSLNSNITTTTLETNDNIMLSVRSPVVLGLDIMPGYLSQQKKFLLYGRVGVGITSFKLQLSDADSPDSDWSKASRNKLAFGVRGGVGGEYFFNESVGLRLEYLITKFSSLSNSYSDLDQGATYSYEVSSPTTNQVNLGITINF